MARVREKAGMNRRRPTPGGGTTQSSVTFTREDYLWLTEVCIASNTSISLLVEEGLRLLKIEHAKALTAIEKEERKAFLEQKRSHRQYTNSSPTQSPIPPRTESVEDVVL